MEKIDIEKSEEINTPINGNTKCNSKQQIVAKANEHPEWLPDGWSVDVRIRKSGANTGSAYKCYIDPLNGYKFYSKPEVLRYLETIKDNSCTSKKEKKCTNTHSPSNVVVDKSTVEDLPPGRIKEVKVRKNGNGTKKDLVVVEKSTVEDLPSGRIKEATVRKNGNGTKKDPVVVEKSTVEDLPPGQIKEVDVRRNGNDTKKDTVVVEKSAVEDLPPGWIKEVKVRKTGTGTKKDPFYTDPVSGYVFRSKKDVLRYLESGDISKCAFKPSRRQIQDEDKSTPSPAAKRQKLKQSAPKQQLFVDADSSRKGQDAKVPSGMMVAPVPTGEFVVKMHSLEDGAANRPGMQKTSDPDHVQEKEHVVNVTGNANEKNHSKPSISKNKEVNMHQRSSRRLAGIEPVQLANNVINEQTLLVPKRNLRKSRTTLDADMENESFQHFKEQLHKLERDKPEDNMPEIHSNSNKSSDKERQIPRRASKRLAGFEHELMSNSISCDKAPKNKSKMSRDEVNAKFQQSKVGPATELADHAPINGESANKGRKSHKIPPITDDWLEKVEDEEMEDEKSEAQLSFAFHYSWSDPSLESAINTLTGVLPAKDSVGNGPTTVLETDIQKTPLDNVSGRSKDGNPSLEFTTNTLTGLLPVEDSVDNGPTTVLGADIQKTSFDNVAGRSRDRKPQVRSNKSKNTKELKVPMRLSKRLAGLEPEVSASERAVEYVSRKACKEEPVATATTILTNGASDHLDSGEETKLTLHASDSLKTEVLGESSNKSEKSYDAHTVPKEQLQKVEAEKIGDERSEQLSLLFGDPWSDPCLEFAIKTLTGALPVDAATDISSVMTPDVNNLSNKELHESVVTTINEEAHDKPNQSQDKKELNMVSQSELRTSSTSCENAPPTFTTRESYSDGGNITRNLNGEPRHIKAGNVTQLVHHSRNINTLLHEEPLKENEQVHERGNITMGQPPLETENHDKPESQFCASFMNSWSDPCLEFAFKTLTGAIPVEDNLSFQGCFQEPANCHDRRDGGSTLPHFESSSFSQSDFSFHYDIGVESRTGQQSSTSSSFPPLEKANLQGFPGVDPPKHCSQFNKNFQR